MMINTDCENYGNLLKNSHGLPWFVKTQTQPITKHESNLTTYWDFHIKTVMILPLKDIIDLDFLLGLDENPENVDTKAVASRDRDIFRRLKDGGRLDDAGLIAGWLEYRRLLFFHETGNGGPGAKLPGALFESFYAWTARGVFACGLAAGGMGAYSFLAYHGSRPVNVTLFIAVFILFPA